MQRRIPLITLAAWFAMLLAAASYGDGKAFHFSDMSALRPLEQHDQAAVINLHEGVERLLIAINVSPEFDERTLWMFPVLGTPDSVTIDIVDRFPRFRGADMRQHTSAQLHQWFWTLRATQVYPLVIPGTLRGLSGAPGSAQEHAAIDRWGIHAETLTASSAADLADFLRADIPTVTEDALQPFAPYLNAEYTLVAAWMSSRDEVRAEFPELDDGALHEFWRPCLLVTFPATEPFYPMKPTASYGNLKMGVTLYVLGHVQPKTTAALARILDVRHFQQGSFDNSLPIELLAGQPRTRIPYTRVSAFSEARNFVDDLRFEPTVPAGWDYASYVERFIRPWTALFSYVVVNGILSYLCGGIAGLLVVRRWHTPASIALLNILTVLALMLAVTRVPLRRKTEDATQVKAEQRAKLWFVLAFTVLFMAATFGLEALVAFPLQPGA